MTTPAKLKEPPKASELAAEIRKNTAERFTQCEALLMHLAKTGERPTPEDRLLFLSLGWPAHIVRSKIAAAAEIIALQKQAGTAAERDEAQRQAAAAKQALDSEGPKLQEEIAKVTADLRRKLNELESAARTAQAAVDVHESARQRLRSRIPEHVRTAAEETFAEIRGRYSARISELRAGIVLARDAQQIDSGTLDGRTRAAHIAKCYTLPSHCAGEPLAAHIHREDYIDPATWKSDVQKLLARVPALEAELAELETKRDAELREAESALDFYLR